ncbi:MAG TPA: S53 family peptidase [Solirubrobacteraceae bacterium]|jgi:hypothetical protein|nr:S53 family peptidase [Solirubrobacteraceae bacterium]
MRSPLLQIPPLIALAVLLVVPAPAPGAVAAETPLPASNYTVRPACEEAVPGFASCLALQLVPVSAEAKRHTHPIGMVRAAGSARPAAPSPKTGELGLTPADIHSVYSLPHGAPAEETIAIVDAYNDPTAEADLKTYSEEFELPLCTSAGGCFTKVGQKAGGGLPFPKTVKELETAKASANEATKEEAEAANGWAVEISLDIESAHATCQSCKIALVEANSPANEDLVAAELRAETLHPNVISNSWGTDELSIEPASDEHAPFDDPGVVITASAGDDGFRNWGARNSFEQNITQYPASSPHVVSVGGTRLSWNGVGEWLGETVWNGLGAGGGGCSEVFQAPSWQLQASDWTSVGCGERRSVADVSADADPYTGAAVYDSADPGERCESEELPHWCTYGGTSLASPIIASVFALAGGANGVAAPAQTLYENLRNAPRLFHDVTSGSNGKCGSYNHATGVSKCTAAVEAAASCKSTFACLAAPGYDGPSGIGTPDGLLGFVPGQHEAPEASPSLGSGTGAASPAPAPGTPPPSSPPGKLPTVTVQLSSLGLTAPALSALARRRPLSGRVAFSFVLNTAARLRVTLVRRVRSHGRVRWISAVASATMTAPAGRSVRHLAGTRRLASGSYRLTVTPAGGTARSIQFRIR